MLRNFALRAARFACARAWLDEVKVEQSLQNIQQPFRFTGLHIHDRTGICRFNRVCREISDVANRVEIFRKICWDLAGIQDLLYLVG